ncbi:MAG: aminopeptidase PepB [Gammaproteobacteria bacterium]|nr:aminopeptidase PepB [Gammaproteobacteria bacterium]
MSIAINVKINKQAAPKEWGKNALTSSFADGILIHIPDELQQLDRIQKVGRQLSASGVPAPQLVGEYWDIESQWAFAQGYMSPSQKTSPQWAALSADEISELDSRYQTASWVREQVNATPEDLSPAILAQNAAEFVQSLKPEAVSYEIVSGDDLLTAGMVGIHGVGRGSKRPPVLLRLDYNPTGDVNKPVDVALVGKGITFDSGGYSIKTSEGMLSMKMDMGGAAHVTGGLALAISRGLDKRVSLLLCCAENLISDHAYKLGDILTYANGTTVEIVNTDAEGRLVLADGLLQASATGAKLIIDAATLTGAANVAVGNEYNAVFALDKELQVKALECADKENEPHWALPLEKFHRNKCPSPFADTANSCSVKGGGAGGASNAAGFLSRFVNDEGKGWLHFDLAGAMFSNDNSLWSAGGSAMGIRTLARLLQLEDN